MEESQAASVSQMDMNEQITSLQQEIQDLKDSLKDENEDRQNIKDSITCKEQILTELQNNAQSMSELPSRSERAKVQTEKMITFQREEMSKKEKRLTTLYEQWKKQVRETRERLKLDITDKEMSELADIIEQRRNYVSKLYSEIRNPKWHHHLT